MDEWIIDLNTHFHFLYYCVSIDNMRDNISSVIIVHH